MEQKLFLSIEDQIKRIKNLGIKIDNIKTTKNTLMENSYYNIINGYRKPFLFHNQNDKFLYGTNFNEIYALYHFDRQLRHYLFSFLLEIENKIKTQVIYTFLNSKDDQGNLIHNCNSYLQINSFECNPRYNRLNKPINLIANMQHKIARSFNESDATTHYLTKYGYVPLWVLSTRMTFGDVYNFFECMISSERQAVSKLYKIPDNDLLTILKILSYARNHCAHGNRMYCINKKVDLPLPDKSVYPIQYYFTLQNVGKHNLLNVYVALKYLLSDKRYKELITKTKYIIDELSNRLHVISIDKINDITGLPADLNSLVKLKQSH
ncbi:MAG TPA: Abi family protein [Candidatus Izemoplasmatales bacterium]|nr:Abi family protein [Candidatus Izemoplasmatales bacterium]